jgi:tricorn protease
MSRVAQSLPRGGDSEGPPRGFGGFGGGISSPQFSRDGRTLYFQERDGIYSVAVSGGGDAAATPASPGPGSGFRGFGGGGSERRRVSFTARVEVDHRAERAQVFNESWRVMKNRFYDPEMHGVDWAKMRALYEPLLDHAADQEEMHNIILQMIGELNASHTGISAGGFGPGGPDGPDRGPQTRYPGFEIQPDPSGYYKVTYIYKNGPADKDYIKIKPGDLLLAIDGQELKTSDNYWRFYNTTPGRKFELTVNSKPSLDDAWKATVEPISSGAHSTLLYEKWVAERKAIVEKLSGGEIGYLHIRAMNAESLRKFERDLVENHFKKALIIDQRFNGGGGIEQELLQILGQRRYQYTQGRDSGVEISRPQRAFFGPMVVMQNEMSGSNAEMFPDGFRRLGLGKVIGVPTLGGVIGTGSFRLMDGSQLRTPSFGVWTSSGQNMENYGVPPDVYADNRPEDFLNGRDAQVEKAVEVLKEELKKR